VFRKKRRCQNLCPSPHPGYHGRQCQREQNHDGMCCVKSGMYRHYWNHQFYKQTGRAF